MLQSTIITFPSTYFKTSVPHFIRIRIIFPRASAGKVPAAAASNQLPQGDVSCQPGPSQRFPSPLCLPTLGELSSFWLLMCIYITQWHLTAMKGHRKLLIDQSKTSWRNRWGCITEMQPHSGDDILLPVHKSLMEYNFIISCHLCLQQRAQLLTVLSVWWWGQSRRAGTNVSLTWFGQEHSQTTREPVLTNIPQDTELSILLKSNCAVLYKRKRITTYWATTAQFKTFKTLCKEV